MRNHFSKKHVPLVGKFAQNNKKLSRPHSNILETIWGNPIHWFMYSKTIWPIIEISYFNQKLPSNFLVQKTVPLYEGRYHRLWAWATTSELILYASPPTCAYLASYSLSLYPGFQANRATAPATCYCI